jgi:hypothetical protein
MTVDLKAFQSEFIGICKSALPIYFGLKIRISLTSIFEGKYANLKENRLEMKERHVRSLLYLSVSPLITLK